MYLKIQVIVLQIKKGSKPKSPCSLAHDPKSMCIHNIASAKE